MRDKTLDEIKLRDLTVHCTIGVYPEEKVRTQALRLNISLYLDTRTAAVSGALSKTVDYARLAKQLAFILQHARFRLLESAAAALSRFILNPPHSEDALARVEAVDIEIIKPEALGDLATPSLRIIRSKQELATHAGFGRQTLFKVPEASVERWTLEAAESLRIELSQASFLMTEEAGLELDDQRLGSLAIVPLRGSHTLKNPHSQAKTVLVVTSHELRAPRKSAGAEAELRE